MCWATPGFIQAGTGKTLTFENTPLSALIIKKVDADSGAMLQGAKFRVRYLGGTSGTGGTVIGEYTTSVNGTIVITGLKAGTYIVEETKAPDGYNRLKEPVNVVITANIASGKTVTATITYNETATGTVRIENQTGVELPSTGGIGTTVFYVIGGLLMGVAVVLLVTRKKMSTSK